MAWIDLDSAPIPRRTLQRRIKADEIPSMICPSTGRRLVWVSRSDAPSWAANLLAQVDGLQAAVETLTSQLSEARMDIASLRSELKLAKTSAPKPEVLSPRPTSERPAERLPRVRLPASTPKKTRAPGTKSAPTPEEEGAIGTLRRLVKATGGQGALSRRSGIAQPSISKWLSGKRYPSEENRATLAKLAKELSAGQAQAA